MKAAQVFSTDIFTATWNGEASLVKAFIEGESSLARAWDVSEYGNGWTPLHYASYRGHTEIVRILIAAKAEINATNDLGFTALFYAAQRSFLDICTLLVDSGADPSIAGA
ncbi:ankyrin repeat-containing domain protein, partial [Ochromonadaceae sp. CCMP2298]